MTIAMTFKLGFAVAFVWVNHQALAFTQRSALLWRHTFLESSASSPTATSDEEVDVIVVGAGIGGLSCAALSAKYGLKTLCLEAHDTPGGCAHSFSRFSSVSKTVPFKFDSGPSLCSGLSSQSNNPLRQVLDAIGTANEIVWVKYDGWLVHDYSDGKSFKLTTGDGGDFERALEEKAGKSTREAFEDFKLQMLEDKGLSEASGYIPPLALRGDLAAVVSLSKYSLKLLSIGAKGTLLTGPFTEIMNRFQLKNEFVRKWFDYIAFALSGEDAAHTQAAPVAYMMSDLHKPGAVLDYPVGGMDSIVRALVKGLESKKGELRLNCRVERLLLEERDGTAECVGVELADGKKFWAKKGVVSNAPLWNLARLAQDSVPDNTNSRSPVAKAVEQMRAQADAMHMTRSFMHLHIGIPKDGLSDELECHHSVLDFSRDVRDEQNMVIISIPTVFDPNLAPEGYHIVHAYTAASDSFDDWVPFLEGQSEDGKIGASPNSISAAKYRQQEGYNKLKEEKVEALWKAIECVIPDVRERAKRKGSVVLIGTPLTHRRYNSRFRGTYGPGPGPNQQLWDLAGASTQIKGLLLCGDTTFPGIGLPAVAASGSIAANTLVSVWDQMRLINELRQEGVLQ